MNKAARVLFALVVLCVPILAQTGKIEGVWRIVEVSSSDGSVNKGPQPNLLIFTKKHYSQTMVVSKEPRPKIDDASKASSADLIAVFVDGFVGNAGRYEVKGGKLTIHAVVAKSPTFMDGTGYITYGVKINGNSMTLMEDSASFGPFNKPDRLKLVRVE